jgi:hypothetical protein
MHRRRYRLAHRPTSHLGVRIMPRCVVLAICALVLLAAGCGYSGEHNSNLSPDQRLHIILAPSEHADFYALDPVLLQDDSAPDSQPALR